MLLLLLMLLLVVRSTRQVVVTMVKITISSAGQDDSFLGITYVVQEGGARVVATRGRCRMLRNGILKRTEGEIVAKGCRHTSRTRLLLAGR